MNAAEEIISGAGGLINPQTHGDDHTFAGVDGLDEAHIKTYVTVGIETDYKYDYMLQTSFMSTELSKTKSKQLKSQMSKMMQSMPRMAQPK